MRCRAPSLFAVLLFVCTHAPIPVNAQSLGKQARLPGFTIEPLFGNGWSIARPAEEFPGLFGYILFKKSPAWFGISAGEIPVPLVSWHTMRRDESIGLEQFIFTKKLGEGPRIGATLVRASWVGIPFADPRQFLLAIAQARESELHKQFSRVLEFQSKTEGDSILPGCLRMDARFGGGTESGHPLIVSTRRYVCPHPDAPGYLVEVGYGQQTPEGETPASLEEETKSFLQSLKFVRQEDLISYSVLQTTFLPVGFSPSHMVLGEHGAWIAVGSSWLLQLEADSRKPVGAVQLHREVDNLVVGSDALWLPKNSIARNFPETLATEQLKFVGHLPHDETQAGFAGGSIWLPSCSVASTMGCANKVARIDLKNHESLKRIKVTTSYGDALSAVGNGDTVWVLNSKGSLVRIDAAKNTVVATLPIGFTARGKLLADARAAWLVDDAVIWRVDVQTNEIKKLDFRGPTEACLGGGMLWVLEFTNSPLVGKNTVHSIRLQGFNAQTLQAASDPVSLGQSEESLDPLSLSGIHLQTCLSDMVWVSDRSGVLFRLDMRPAAPARAADFSPQTLRRTQAQ